MIGIDWYLGRRYFSTPRRVVFERTSDGFHLWFGPWLYASFSLVRR